jgi:hypothetical protein
MRRTASQEPRQGPKRRSASTAYRLQLGWKRQTGGAHDDHNS